MKKIIIPIISFACIANAQEITANNFIRSYESIIDITAAVKDKATADAAADKLKPHFKIMVKAGQLGPATQMRLNADLQQMGITENYINKLTDIFRAHCNRIGRAQFYGSEKLKNAFTELNPKKQPST